MYGLGTREMLLVWLVVTLSLWAAGVLLIAGAACWQVAVDWWGERKRRKARAERRQREDALAAWDPEPELDEHGDGLIYALADQGDEVLEKDRNLGVVYKLPKQRRAA